MKQWRKGFDEFPPMLKELDLVEDGDKIMHEGFHLDDNTLRAQEMLNIFKPVDGPEYVRVEKEWKKISKV